MSKLPLYLLGYTAYHILNAHLSAMEDVCIQYYSIHTCVHKKCTTLL